MLNHVAPRPGETYRLPVGMPGEEVVTIEATFPGALDFDRGLVKVDFQIWPLFQAIDVDHIFTCVEVRGVLAADLKTIRSHCQITEGSCSARSIRRC